MALVGALALLASLPAPALALGTSVEETVRPKVVKVGASFSASASGEATQHDVLWQFLDFKRCAATEKAESRRHVASEHDAVYGVFSVGPLSAEAHEAGGDHVCAYLVHHGRTLARDVAKFEVVR